ncbi:hypothetical protein Q5752_003464 [Cryptotrichosporon argae]
MPCCVKTDRELLGARTPLPPYTTTSIMANIIEGIFHTVEGILQSILAVIQTIFGAIYGLVAGVFSFAFHIVEGLAQFLGASVHFVISNIVVLGLIAVAVVIYQDRNRRGTVGNKLKKKAQ